MAWYWILWAGLVIVLTTIEIVTVTLYLAMIAGGCFVAFLVSLTPVHWWWQVIIAAVVSLALIFTVRKPLLRALGRGGDQAKSNVDALIGQSGQVIHAITPTSGQVKLSNGETWSARLSTSPAAPASSPTAGANAEEVSPVPLPIDSWVSVVAVEGATVLITPVTGPALSTP